MKMREFMDLIDHDVMEIDVFSDLIDKMDRSGPNSTPEDLSAMYGVETEIETEEAKLAKIRAEIAKLNAAAEKDRVIAADYYSDGKSRHSA